MTSLEWKPGTPEATLIEKILDLLCLFEELDINALYTMSECRNKAMFEDAMRSLFYGGKIKKEGRVFSLSYERELKVQPGVCIEMYPR